jgi:hypothetical protein
MMPGVGMAIRGWLFGRWVEGRSGFGKGIEVERDTQGVNTYEMRIFNILRFLPSDELFPAKLFLGKKRVSGISTFIDFRREALFL